MNGKMTTNSQLSTTEPEKQTLRITEMRSRGGLQQGGGGEKMVEKVQGIRSINGKNKIDKGRLRIV